MDKTIKKEVKHYDTLEQLMERCKKHNERVNPNPQFPTSEMFGNDSNKFYYIENSVDEHNSDITAYCRTMDEALERLKTCHDWYGEMGTGRIYEVEFGKGTAGRLVYNKE